MLLIQLLLLVHPRIENNMLLRRWLHRTNVLDNKELVRSQIYGIESKEVIMKFCTRASCIRSSGSLN